MWRYREPSPDDYSSEEEYQAALDAYDDAEDQYVDEYLERHNCN